MKNLVIILALLVGAYLPTMAQNPDSVTQHSVEELNKLDNNSAVDAMNDSAQTPAPVVQQTPPPAPVDDSGPNMLVMGVLTLCGIIGIVLALVAFGKIKKVKAEKDDEIAALKTALQKRCAEFDNQIDELNRRVAMMEESQDDGPVVDAYQAPVRETQPVQPAVDVPRMYYLTRPDDNGYFMAATTRMEPGNSIFVLTTTNGQSGTYRVIDDAGVHQLALMMPTENLTRACTGDGIQVSSGMSRIVTDRPGTAVKDGARWRIVNPANIHYEA